MYKLPNNIDPSKVFLINRSELEGRIDPNQYHIERKEAIAKLKKNNQLLKLKDVVKNVKTTTTQVSENNTYIGLENIASNTGEYIETKDKLSISSAGIFKKGQILFPKLRPYLNKVYLAEFDGICSTEFHIFKSDTFLNEFLTIYLRSDLIVNQTKHLMTGNTLPRLQTDDINNLPVPNISIEKQQQIVDLYNIAFSQKQQKEAEAKQLLESIDVYLLKELGITLPEKDNSLTNRIFKTSFKEISGGRFDPKLYDSTTIGLKNAIRNANSSRFKVVSLKEFITQSAAGDWGIDEYDEYDDDLIKCLVIRATEFDNNFNLKLENARVKYRLIKKDKLSKIDIKRNDLLIEKSGGSIDQPVGRVSILTKEILNNNSICYSNFIHKIRVDETILNPQYLYYFLKTIHNSKLTESMQSQTNGIRNLIMSNYLNQNIVIPINIDGKYDFAKQTEIANHINDLVNKAKQLQEQALSILNQAKREVEQIILG